MSDSWMKKTVKIVRLDDPDRDVSGTMGLVQPPEVGDIGEVIYEYPAPDLRVTVEKKDPAGGTLWFADFSRNELELTGEDEAK